MTDPAATNEPVDRQRVLAYLATLPGSIGQSANLIAMHLRLHPVDGRQVFALLKVAERDGLVQRDGYSYRGPWMWQITPAGHVWLRERSRGLTDEAIVAHVRPRPPVADPDPATAADPQREAAFDAWWSEAGPWIDGTDNTDGLAHESFCVGWEQASASERRRWERAVEACTVQLVRPGLGNGPAHDATVDVIPVAGLTALLTQLREEAADQ